MKCFGYTLSLGLEKYKLACKAERMLAGWQPFKIFLGS